MNDTSAASGTPGQQEEFVALHLKTTRASFDELDHDRVDPTAALEGLGGRLAYDNALPQRLEEALLV